MKSLTRDIAHFITQNRYEQMPERAVIAAKEAILDGMGCALAGSVEPVSRTITEYVREMGGNPDATVIAGGFKVSAPQAALANGTMAHALDYDDTFATSTGIICILRYLSCLQYLPSVKSTRYQAGIH